MVRVTDWPGSKLNAPPPLITENGAVRASTFPVNVAGEPGSLVMVTVSFAACPTSTLPKLTLMGVTEILMTGTGVTPVPFNAILTGLEG